MVVHECSVGYGEWKVIPGFDAYAVSTFGHVKRVRTGPNTAVGKILKPKLLRYGYVAYDLWHNGKVFRKSAQRLVALAFLGPPPLLTMEAAHKDGNPQHNHVSNIYWSTHYENMKDMEKHGTVVYGDRHYNVVLSTAHVAIVRQRYVDGETDIHALAQEYGLSYGHMNDIIRGARRTRAPGPISVRHGRRGPTHHSAKLTENDIRVIRARYRGHETTRSQLAQEFHVSSGMIFKIVHGLVWMDVHESQ
jgi:NUMOD4 motif/HNH endonuclease